MIQSIAASVVVYAKQVAEFALEILNMEKSARRDVYKTLYMPLDATVKD